MRQWKRSHLQRRRGQTALLPASAVHSTAYVTRTCVTAGTGTGPQIEEDYRVFHMPHGSDAANYDYDPAEWDAEEPQDAPPPKPRRARKPPATKRTRKAKAAAAPEAPENGHQSAAPPEKKPRSPGRPRKSAARGGETPETGYRPNGIAP